MVEWWVAWFTTLAAAALGWFWNWHVHKVAKLSGEKNAEDLLRDARKKAEVTLREARAQSQTQLAEARKSFDLEFKERRERLEVLEDKHHERVLLTERKSHTLDDRETGLTSRQSQLEEEQAEVERLRAETEEVLKEQKQKLENLSGLSAEQAGKELLLQVEEDLKAESAKLIRHAQHDMQSRSKEEAQKILTYAIERYAAETVHDVTTTSVHLPSEEMKGRIIGKEGRNIRSFESETGINLVIDDTPQVVVLSGYDPMRREIARIALQRLVEDGRIHPVTIESTVQAVRKEVEDTVRKAGEDAVFDLELAKVDPEVIYTLGRLKYRQSFSQNVLEHSIEMAHLMSGMAAEMGLDIQIAKRVGLFHDIGKALTHEVEGSHALIGADLIRAHGESDVVVNAVAAHHREVEPESVYAHLAMAADVVTAARPGARIEKTELYLKRLSDLEEIANSFPGVKSSYAVQAGKELRVLVEPDQIQDDDAILLARKISEKIEQDVHFPGQVKVTVIRETRSVEYAR